jgi:peptidoglycan hydrolase FlgJ
MTIRLDAGAPPDLPQKNDVGVGKGAPKASNVREAAMQFEGILVRQMLAPLEKSLTAGSGGGSSPMVGGMVMESLSQGILAGGGLGLADIVEEALRGLDSAPKSGPENGEK